MKTSMIALFSLLIITSNAFGASTKTCGEVHSPRTTIPQASAEIESFNLKLRELASQKAIALGDSKDDQMKDLLDQYDSITLSNGMIFAAKHGNSDASIARQTPIFDLLEVVVNRSVSTPLRMRATRMVEAYIIKATRSLRADPLFVDGIRALARAMDRVNPMSHNGRYIYETMHIARYRLEYRRDGRPLSNSLQTYPEW